MTGAAPGRGWTVSSGVDGDRRAGASLEHALAHLLERSERQHAQPRLIVLAAACLHADLDHAQQAMKGVLHGVEVLDLRERHVPFVAEQQARPDHELARVVAQTKGQVAHRAGDHGGHKQ